MADVSSPRNDVGSLGQTPSKGTSIFGRHSIHNGGLGELSATQRLQGFPMEPSNISVWFYRTNLLVMIMIMIMMML